MRPIFLGHALLSISEVKAKPTTPLGLVLMNTDMVLHEGISDLLPFNATGLQCAYLSAVEKKQNL